VTSAQGRVEEVSRDLWKSALPEKSGVVEEGSMDKRGAQKQETSVMQTVVE
jgi:hypothetical protein